MLAIDFLIILAYFALILTIGLRMGRREDTLEDFALGGRRVPWWAVMASIIAAETSAATFLGAPGEGYAGRSFAYVQLFIGLVIGRVLVGYVFLKPYYDYRVYTVYDYLGVRFGPASKNYVSALFLLMRTLASGTRLFVPSLVMVLAWQMLTRGHAAAAATTFTPPTHVSWYVIAIVVLTILTCVYTALGGIKAVIWTDVVQATLMFGTALLAIGLLLHQVGGIGALSRAVPELKTTEGYFLTGFEPSVVAKWKIDHHLSVMGPLDYLSLILNTQYTLFSALLASTAVSMAAFGTDQDMVQRMLTAETYQKSRRSLVTAAVMDLPINLAFAFIGILLFAYYQRDPTFKPTSSADVFGSYILYVMPTGVRGLVLAGVFATAMGSLSAALNALATSATNDWYIPYLAPRATERHHVAAARWFTAVFAVLMILIAAGFAYAKVKDPTVRIIPVVLGIANFILGPMLGVFLVGMLTRTRGSDVGNTIAVTLGLLTTVYVGELHNEALKLIGLERYVRPPVVKVAFTWFALVGATVVFAVAVCFRTPQHVLDEARRRREQSSDR
jgi:SSS family solute:Na+ symporter